MIITRLTEKDLSSLGNLFTQFWGESSQIEKMRISYQKISDNPSYILLAAKQEDDLMGFGMGIICEELYCDCKPFMVIEDLIVDKNQRRSGIGSGLIQELEKQAIANNCCQIIFVTETDRSDAQRFYESLGYKSEPYKGFKKEIESGQQIKD